MIERPIFTARSYSTIKHLTPLSSIFTHYNEQGFITVGINHYNHKRPFRFTIALATQSTSKNVKCHKSAIFITAVKNRPSEEGGFDITP
ncbi:hypothetical protein [Shewanella subflava]|uniref:Uncharacterized protein n=1 Tax=Shewanella subflava TaxID=2986476 RepID=A0ABT3IDJ8_9GAMM|nr:hypothetical protein [Shewanella subflava]MCW3174127.1 hypothetical protein [Shewanella subflava]